MKIFITGGTGLLGGFLIEELIKKGHKIRALVRRSSNLKYLKNLNVELVYGDVTDVESLNKSTKNIDIVIHLASLIHPVNVPDSLYYTINVKGTENVFNAAYKNNKHKLKQFIHCSSVTVYDIPDDDNEIISENFNCNNQITIYGKTKYEGELAITKLTNKYKIPLTIIRPARVYGERDKSLIPICKLMKKRFFFNIGSGKTFMQPVYVDDCVQAIINTINNKKTFGNRYNIAGLETINKKKFLKIISLNLGKKMPSLNVPIFIVKTAAIINELICKPFNKDPFISRKKLAFFLRSNKYEISAAQKDLKYNPKIKPKQGIKRTIEWYKKEKLI